jgi:hypothetical protein
MTEDLEAIDLLSEQFSTAVEQVAPYGGGDSIVIPTSIANQGQKILRMYEAEARNAPDDVDVKGAMAIHLYHLAYMYYRAYNPILMGDGSSQKEQIGFLQSVCSYANQSIEIFPTSAAAFLLADVYRMNRFYGTALHWYREAETFAAETDNKEIATKAKAKRLDLQSDGRTSDPPITRQTKFPLPNTPGLMQTNTPNTSVAAPPNQAQYGINQNTADAVPAGAKSGCMGVLAVIACLSVVLVMLLIANAGSSSRRTGSAMATRPAYSTALNTGTAHFPSQETNTSHNPQDWRGEHFPQTRNGYLREADIQGWSYSGVRYALNEMYARHGYSFNDKPLSHQFHKFAWYRPVAGQTSAGIEAQFTTVERANQRLLAERRKVLVQEGKAIK